MPVLTEMAKAGLPLSRDVNGVAALQDLKTRRRDLDLGQFKLLTDQDMPLSRALELVEPMLDCSGLETVQAFRQMSGDLEASKEVAMALNHGPEGISFETRRDAVAALFHFGHEDLRQAHSDFRWLLANLGSPQDLDQELTRFLKFLSVANSSRDARLAATASRNQSQQVRELNRLALVFSDDYAGSRAFLAGLSENLSEEDKLARLSLISGQEARVKAMPPELRQSLAEGLLQAPLEKAAWESVLSLLGTPQALTVALSGPHWNATENRLIYASEYDTPGWQSVLNFEPIQLPKDGQAILELTNRKPLHRTGSLTIEASTDGNRWSGLSMRYGSSSLNSYEGRKVWLRMRKSMRAPRSPTKPTKPGRPSCHRFGLRPLGNGGKPWSACLRPAKTTSRQFFPSGNG